MARDETVRLFPLLLLPFCVYVRNVALLSRFVSAIVNTPSYRVARNIGEAFAIEALVVNGTVSRENGSISAKSIRNKDNKATG